MAFITWVGEFSVGVDSLDAEHIKLVEYINRLHLGVSAGGGIASMTDVLDGLVDYTRNHFRHEEELMREHGYPGLAEQQKEHRELVDKVKDYLQRLESGKTAFTLELMGFLRDWLLNHIKGTDMKYREFFMSRGVN